ncbi:MAG: Stp1/IreP family PP2C-type Ser/Thr phosphatase [Gammaproteobacteria bacterium]
MNLKGILSVAGRTDTGKVRSHNEDFLGENLDIGLVALADGMGGYKSGEVASELAISTVLSELEERIPQLTPGELDQQTGYSNESLAVREAIISANEKIYQKGMNDPECRGMGTTLVMAVLYNNQVTIAHVGDSRMYRYRSSKLEQVTVDHTFLQELVDRGYYTQEEADASLNRNLVTRALGIQPTTAVDIREDMVIPGDIYLLCSDGLTDMVDDQEISNIVSEFRDNLDKIAENLVECANDKGGRDNISVLLAQPTKAFPEKKRWNTNLKKIFGQ